MINRYLRLHETETVTIAQIIDDIDTMLSECEDYDQPHIIAHARLGHILFLLSAGTGAGQLPVSMLRNLWNRSLASVYTEDRVEYAYTDAGLTDRFSGVPSRVWIN
jgi:polyhydroxyalkanoate synthesis regulator protein